MRNSGRVVQLDLHGSCHAYTANTLRYSDSSDVGIQGTTTRKRLLIVIVLRVSAPFSDNDEPQSRLFTRRVVARRPGRGSLQNR